MIKTAILNKNLLSFIYDGKLREGEPHIWGMSGGKEYLLFYQLSGGSNSKNPYPWRMCELDKIENLQILNQKFAGSRGDGSNTKFTEIFAVVR